MRALFVSATVLFLVGCSGDPHQRGQLHGTVTYKGKPLTNGMVIFMGADQQSHIADLDQNGSYKIDRIPFGPVKVAIQQQQPRPASRPKPSANTKGGMSESKDAAREVEPPPEPKQSGVMVPVIYNNAESSGLVFEMKESNQEWNGELK